MVFLFMFLLWLLLLKQIVSTLSHATLYVFSCMVMYSLWFRSTSAEIKANVEEGLNKTDFFYSSVGVSITKNLSLPNKLAAQFLTF